MAWHSDNIGSGQRVTKPLEKTGADFSGGNGAENRTYTLPAAATSDQPIVIIDGQTLHLGASKDYTVSSGVITILAGLDNSSNVSIYYFEMS